MTGWDDENAQIADSAYAVLRVEALPVPAGAVRVRLPGEWPWVELAISSTRRGARIDRVVWRAGRLLVLSGIPRSADEGRPVAAPSEPADVSLALVKLPANTVCVVQAMLTDVREFPRTWEATGYVFGVAPVELNDRTSGSAGATAAG